MERFHENDAPWFAVTYQRTFESVSLKEFQENSKSVGSHRGHYSVCCQMTLFGVPVTYEDTVGCVKSLRESQEKSDSLASRSELLLKNVAVRVDNDLQEHTRISRVEALQSVAQVLVSVRSICPRVQDLE